MNDYIPVVVYFCLMLVASLVIYFLVYENKVKELSTYTYVYSEAKYIFEETAKTFEQYNSGYCMRVVKIDCSFGWNFYYKIERK